MQHHTSRLPPQEHFQRLLSRMPAELLERFQAASPAQAETAFRGRIFEASGSVRVPIIIEDYAADCGGAHVTLTVAGREYVISHTPTLIEDAGVFIFLPLHGRTDYWSLQRGGGRVTSLAFNLIFRPEAGVTVAPRRRG